MALQVVTTAVTQCSMGTLPGVLLAVPLGPPVLGCSLPAANIMHIIPFVNLLPFGVCSSGAAIAAFAAAGAMAASGAPPPPPPMCVPTVPAPWMPGSSTVLVNNLPALNDYSTCACVWGGLISIVSPGQFTIEIP
jgi:hypothetical protein